MKNLVIFSILGAAVLSVVLLLGTTPWQTQSTITASATENPTCPPFCLVPFVPKDHAYQIDLGLGPFYPFGKPGYFKLLGDFTPGVSSGHIAASNINCDKNGLSPLKILLANALTGSGATKGRLITLNSSNMINDVSSKGSFCTYHVEFSGPQPDELHNAGLFTVTDIAIVNTFKGSNVQPHPTASATLHATDCVPGFDSGLTPEQHCIIED